MKRSHFRQTLIKLHTLSKAQFSTLYDHHLDADRDWIHFQRSPADFFVTAPHAIQEGLWQMVRR